MKRRWETDELVDHWTLLPAELTLLANKTGATRLGFAVLLKSFQVEARFPQRKQDVPGAVVVFVAKQVGVAAEEFLQYQWRGRTIEYHRAQIRTALGFREATEQDEAALASWLTEAALAEDRDADRLKLRAYERCRALGLEPPAPGAYDAPNRNGVPFLLERNGTSLSLAVPPAVPPGTADSDAFGINAPGDIVGDYPDSSGVGHGYLLVGARRHSGPLAPSTTSSGDGSPLLATLPSRAAAVPASGVNEQQEGSNGQTSPPRMLYGAI